MQTVSQIEAKRRRYRITRTELCRTAGVHLQTYRRWVADESSPTLRRLTKVSQAIDQLIPRDEPAREATS